ncbi:cytochrome b561 and DOMON domain-containing protein [Prunus yedoensis var. nudiflora]|uniref:Cytochrome b561 and DOMON domain-containing protein n=1 Tax=Prunus yedoensis var. nudiflora TaxID=2094558 RepID=A0A314Z4N1_PRUYE|nr:cytochrome b561 and DOMON domain-containing protein [Prunus yedoensis var. nudiflora]
MTDAWGSEIFGWGTLLPIGAITARYFRKFPFKCSEWYSVHIKCQSGGYIVGTVGWCSGMFLGNSSKQQSNNTHRVLGMIIFTFATIQMLAMFWRPKGENGFPKYVKICHHLLGYALIALTIANIFEGINNRAHAAKWKWTYVGILCVLGVTALGLEIFKWIKRAMMREAMKLNSNMYTSP